MIGMIDRIMGGLLAQSLEDNRTNLLRTQRSSKIVSFLRKILIAIAHPRRWGIYFWDTNCYVD